MNRPRRSLPLLPSASRLAGAAVCVAPWSLELPRRETTSEAAEMGRHFHSIAEEIAAFRGERLPMLGANKAIVEHIAKVVRADALAMKQGSDGVWFVEQGIRYRRSFPLDEAELCERTPGQEERGWFSGTADLVYVRADGVLVVVDWKFGHLTERLGDPAEEHWQLWMLALALATYFGIVEREGSRIVARVELRHVDEEGCRVDGADVTAGELAAFAASLAEIEARIEAGEGPHIGQACGRCSARHACDAYQGMTSKAIEAITGAAPSSPLFGLPTTPEEAVALWRMVEAIAGALPLARANVETFARAHGPLPLGMGLELRAKATKGRDDALDTPEAIAAAEALLGVPAASFTRATTSKGAMLKAWAQKSGKGATSADGRKVVKALKEAGVIVEGAPGVRLEVIRQEESEEE